MLYRMGEYEFSQMMEHSTVRLQCRLSLIGPSTHFNKNSKYAFILKVYLEIFN